MKHISALKLQFDRLPVTEANYALYDRLMSLDISVYKPILDEILAGRLDIEDTRPMFNVTINSIVNPVAMGTPLNQLITNAAGLKANLINRVFNKTQVIKEADIGNASMVSTLQQQIADNYFAQTGIQLTTNQISVLVIAVQNTQKLNLTTQQSKAAQIVASNLLSVKP